MVRPKKEEETAGRGKKKVGPRTPEEQFIHAFVGMHREKGFTDSQLIEHSKKKWITLPAAKKRAWSDSAKLEATKLKLRAKSAEAREKEMIANPYMRMAQTKKRISRQVMEVEEQGEEASKEDIEWAKEQEASLLTLERKSRSNRTEERATSFTSTGDVEIGAPPRKRPRLNEVPQEIPDTDPLVTFSITSSGSGGAKAEEVRESSKSRKRTESKEKKEEEKVKKEEERKLKKEEERRVKKEEERKVRKEEKDADSRGSKRRESSRSRSDRRSSKSEREEKSHKHKHRSHKEKERDSSRSVSSRKKSTKEEGRRRSK